MTEIAGWSGYHRSRGLRAARRRRKGSVVLTCIISGSVKDFEEVERGAQGRRAWDGKRCGAV